MPFQEGKAFMVGKEVRSANVYLFYIRDTCAVILIF